MVEPVACIVRATHNYGVPEDRFLPLKARDVILVLEKEASGWCYGLNTDGKKGIVPLTYTAPMVFALPSECTEMDARRIRHGRTFGVDLRSDHPTPVHLVNCLGHHRQLPAVAHNLSAICKEVEQFILLRETQKEALLTAFDELDRSQRLHSPPATSKRSSTGCVSVLSSNTKQEKAAEGVTSSAVLRGTTDADHSKTVQSLQEELNQLLCKMYTTTPMNSTALMAAKAHTCTVLPPVKWYDAVHHVERTARVEERYAAQLQEVQEVVKATAVVLEALSTQVRETDALYKDRAAELGARVASRDAAVSDMLRAWAARAEAARDEYLACKAHGPQLQRGLLLEETELRRLLPSRKERYLQLQQQVRDAKLLARQTRERLLRRAELQELDRRIQLTDELIAKGELGRASTEI